MKPGLYTGFIVHDRPVAPRYRFRYRYVTALLDLDRLADLDAEVTGFSYNRAGPVSFHDRDHGPKDGGALRPWLDTALAEAGIGPPARCLLMATPRVLGHAFNPLSVWFCLDAHGQPTAVLAEVRNTFGEWHGYLLHQDGAAMRFPIRSEAVKQFHVSPFLPMDGFYRFRIGAPGNTYSASVQYHGDTNRPLTRNPGKPAAGRAPDDAPSTLRLSAVHAARYRPLTRGALLRLALRLPPPGIRALAGIHWEAMKIWMRGGRFHSKPPRPRKEIHS